ncbi:C2 domain-containing protein [Entamoeba marina]
MDIKVVLEKYGIAGIETIGYLDVVIDKPLTIKNAFVKLTLNSTIYFHSEATFAVHEYDKPNLKPGYSFNSYTDKQDIDFFQCIGFNEELDTEYPPGNYQFPFCFTLPKNYQPTLLIPKFNLRSDYSLTGIIETTHNRIVGSVEEFPILYNIPDIPNEIQNKTTKFADDLYIELTQPKQTYVQGETIDAILNVKSYKKSIPELEVLIIGVYNQDTIIFKEEYSSFYFEPSDEGYASPLSFTLPNTIPPTTSTNVLSWNYFIAVNIIQPKKSIPLPRKTEKIQVCFPFNIMASKPSSVDMIQEYMDYLKKSIQLDLDTVLTPPNYIFSNQTSNGTELIEMINSESMLLDHINRNVFEIHNKEVISSTMHYPFIESTTLSPGLTYEVINGKECIIDHINKKGCWVFEQKDKLQTQAQKCNCLTPIVSIELLEGKELKFPKKKNPPPTFCYVEDDTGKCLKTKEIKMPNQLFNLAKCVVYPSNTKSNIVIYFYYKRSVRANKLVGFINLDLIKIPFHSYFEKWCSIQSVTQGDDYFVGKVKLRIGYDEKINSGDDSLIIINEIKQQESGNLKTNNTI